MGLFDLFSNSDAEQAAQQASAGLRAGYGDLSNLYGQGRNAITTGYGTATNLYNPLIASTGAGASAYGDASGANGAAGLQRATQNFESSPQYGAYGFSLDQGLQSLNRTHAAAGNLASGNADTDAMKYATGLAGQQYSNYLAGLNPYLAANSNAVAGGANAAVGQGNALNQSYQGQGQSAYNTQAGIGSANAAATMNNYNVGSNILGAITGVGGLLSGGLGSGLLGGLGGLFSGFGGANGGTASSPLPGLTAADYGPGASLFDQYGL